MGLGEKLKDFIAPQVEEESDELELTEQEAHNLSQYEDPKVQGATKSISNANIVLFEPRHFDESKEIADHVKAQKACVVNLHRLDGEYRRRAVDFLTGVVYALDGTIKKIDSNLILCSPKSMVVGGDINLGPLPEEKE